MSVNIEQKIQVHLELEFWMDAPQEPLPYYCKKYV
jgi:hypothetical protein